MPKSQTAKPSILFSHQNFPAQFGAFGQYLAQQGWDVTFATTKLSGQVPASCRLLQMKPHRAPADGVHRFAVDLEKAMINGQAFANAAMRARDADGLVPDLVFAHSGWGSGTFCKAVWPACKYVAYVEWFYSWPAVDVVADVSNRREEDRRAHALARNAPILLDLAQADAVYCPTQFQAARFPDRLRDQLLIEHDGVDAARLAPDPHAALTLPGITLPPEAEVISYATRGMEPQRGFPDFMRAVAVLLGQRPHLHVVIGGEDRVSYGAKLPDGDSWKARMLKELDLDLSRVHFTGRLPYPDYVQLLQATDLHVYFTVPFVLSWSLIEAMSVGCALVASDNDAVREAIADGQSGVLVDHTDVEAAVAAISSLLDDKARAQSLGKAARQTVLDRYDRGQIWPARADALHRLIES